MFKKYFTFILVLSFCTVWGDKDQPTKKRLKIAKKSNPAYERINMNVVRTEIMNMKALIEPELSSSTATDFITRDKKLAQVKEKLQKVCRLLFEQSSLQQFQPNSEIKRSNYLQLQRNAPDMVGILGDMTYILYAYQALGAHDSIDGNAPRLQIDDKFAEPLQWARAIESAGLTHPNEFRPEIRAHSAKLMEPGTLAKISAAIQYYSGAAYDALPHDYLPHLGALASTLIKYGWASLPVIHETTGGHIPLFGVDPQIHTFAQYNDPTVLEAEYPAQDAVVSSIANWATDKATKGWHALSSWRPWQQQQEEQHAQSEEEREAQQAEVTAHAAEEERM